MPGLLAALTLMRLAGWMGILGPMLIFAGLRDVHIAGGVPASKMIDADALGESI
jgi:hypothetical protein